MPDSCCGAACLMMMAISEPSLMQIHEYASAFFGNPLERSVDHFAAIAATIRKRHHAAPRMHAHQHVLLLSDIAPDQRQMCPDYRWC